MGTIIAASLLTQVRQTLLDINAVRWTESELLGWLNEGQRAIFNKRPDACSTYGRLQLRQGTLQALPDQAVRLLRMFRNLGPTGEAPGRATRQASLELLDAALPSWHTDTPTAEVENYCTDTRMPHNFWVYPPSVGDVYVEAVWAVPPSNLTDTNRAISLDDVFSEPLVDYILFRALSKNQAIPGDVSRAQAHYQLFMSALNDKVGADSATNPVSNNLKA